MKLTNLKTHELITPKAFDLTDLDILFNDVVEAVNSELETAVENQETIYNIEGTVIEVTIDNDFFEGVLPLKIVTAIDTLYQTVGWLRVDYKYEEETEEEYEHHKFTFVFDSSNKISI